MIALEGPGEPKNACIKGVLGSEGNSNGSGVQRIYSSEYCILCLVVFFYLFVLFKLFFIFEYFLF
jgi:hypothetical protein